MHYLGLITTLFCVLSFLQAFVLKHKILGAFLGIMATVSLLESVAQHEKSLMADLDRAREESRQIIEAAHADSASALQDTNTKLEADMATLRREAAQEREKVRGAIQKATAESVQSIRSESTGRTAEVRSELLARILPNV